MPRRLVLDCDTGTDDAIAIMLACSRPELELLGVTAVWGNHAVEHTADNSLRTLDLVGRTDIPVFAGCAGPIEPGAEQQEGSPEPDTLAIPPSARSIESVHAVEWLVETARAATEQFTLVPTGSLSTIASAVRADRGIVEAIDEIVVMGGVVERGGALPEIETNVGYDPEAAQVVLAAGFERLVLVTLDATYRATVTSEQCDLLREAGGVAARLAEFIEQRIARYRLLPAMGGRAAAPVHDALTIAYLLDPTLVTLHPGRVQVATGPGATRGRTDIELDPTVPAASDILVAVDADAPRFFDLLRESLGGPSGI